MQYSQYGGSYSRKRMKSYLRRNALYYAVTTNLIARNCINLWNVSNEKSLEFQRVSLCINFFSFFFFFLERLYLKNNERERISFEKEDKFIFSSLCLSAILSDNNYPRREMFRLQYHRHSLNAVYGFIVPKGKDSTWHVNRKRKKGKTAS